MTFFCNTTDLYRAGFSIAFAIRSVDSIHLVDLFDCGVRKLTVCTTRARPILYVITHIVIVH